jgi:hypothetical protein
MLVLHGLSAGGTPARRLGWRWPALARTASLACAQALPMGAGASAPTPGAAEALLPAQRMRVQSLVGAAACSSDADGRTSAIGAKACSGPEAYMACGRHQSQLAPGSATPSSDKRSVGMQMLAAWARRPRRCRHGPRWVSGRERPAQRAPRIGVPQLKPQIQDRPGKLLALSMVYRMLARHGWRKLAPDTSSAFVTSSSISHASAALHRGSRPLMLLATRNGINCVLIA